MAKVGLCPGVAWALLLGKRTGLNRGMHARGVGCVSGSAEQAVEEGDLDLLMLHASAVNLYHRTFGSMRL